MEWLQGFILFSFDSQAEPPQSNKNIMDIRTSFGYRLSRCRPSG